MAKNSRIHELTPIDGHVKFRKSLHILTYREAS